MRGAFTGAVESRLGLFQAADGGTLMLDEIGDLPPQVQVKLLRVLQDGEIKRVGANEPVRVDVRVVAATHVDLGRAMRDGRFREDLYYRVGVITIPLPPLRERADDIPLLAHHFLSKYAARSGREVTRFSAEALRELATHAWPGNVRELENAVERAVVMAGGSTVLPGDLPPAVLSDDEPAAGDRGVLDLPFAEAKRRTVADFEETYVRHMIRRAGGNVSQAARQAGLDRSNFRRILRKYKRNE